MRLTDERHSQLRALAQFGNLTNNRRTLPKTFHTEETRWANRDGGRKSKRTPFSASIILRADPSQEKSTLANGERYPLVGLPAQAGGRRQRHFAGTNFKPRKLLENAATPTSRVHAVLGNFTERQPIQMKINTQPILTCFTNLCG